MLFTSNKTVECAPSVCQWPLVYRSQCWFDTILDSGYVMRLGDAERWIVARNRSTAVDEISASAMKDLP